LVNYFIFNTCVGWMGVGISQLGLQKVILPRETKPALLSLINGQGNTVIEGCDNGNVSTLIQRITRYMAGEYMVFPDQLDLSKATTFQRNVWSATRVISYGETKSYGWIAEKIGCPGGARAVGQALGDNPLPLIIPCHRVISSNGSLGGFTGGLNLKKYLLVMESKIRSPKK
jgi:methylated-DNA-[protein]-cysteine S-methyltransferase